MWATRHHLREIYAALDAARSYPEWVEAAEALDEQTGATSWREDDASPHYDAEALRQSMQAMERLRREGDALGLASHLTEDLYRYLNDLTAPELYQGALAGPKRLVERYLDKAEASLVWLAGVPSIPPQVLLRRFEEAWRVFGRSALMLSGGATWGFHHLGVVKALFAQGLLPSILSGASTGAMIAAGACTRSDAELADLFANPEQMRLDGLAPLGVRRALGQGALLDPDQLREVLCHNLGDLTFAEAHERSGRVLNISVSPVRHRQKPRLLTHLTAPDVLVTSAVLASSALPGLFPPVVLERRTAAGHVQPYIYDERWVDGSISGDLPKRRLSRLHNVNHFIVSQTNPHVLPFVRHHARPGIRPVVTGLLAATARSHSTWATELARRISRSGRIERTATALHSVINQEYGGDIDLHPQFRWDLARRVVANPSPAELVDFILEGERSVWPHIALIRDQTRIGRAFQTCVGRLRATQG